MLNTCIIYVFVLSRTWASMDCITIVRYTLLGPQSASFEAASGAHTCYHNTHTQATPVQAHSKISLPEKKRWQADVRARKTGVSTFTTITDMAEERWRLMLTEIRCQAPAWSLGIRVIILVVDQVDFTTVSKRMSLKSVHIFDTTSFSICQHSCAWPSPSRVYLAARHLCPCDPTSAKKKSEDSHKRS